MSQIAAAAPPPARPWKSVLFVLVMLALTVFFLGLAKWQLDRLAWKQGLIAQAEANMQQPPSPFPPVADWKTLDPQGFSYRPVTVTGHYLNDQAVRVFVGLGDSAKGQYSGPGYWIMTPFALDGGGTVFVDRGFVPQELASRYADDKAAPTGTITLHGSAIASEQPGLFAPAAEPAHRVDWVRNVDRLSKLVDPLLAPFAPVYIDLPAGPRGALPQGGETTVDLPNNHLGYACTWLGFALTTAIMLAEWTRRQWMRRHGEAA